MAAIDDVQFLLENSEEDSVQVVVDSRDRDYRIHPHPSEYVVNFDVPIRNVYGLEVLDATLASSMYNIDRHNNQFRLVMIDFPGPLKESDNGNLAGADMAETIIVGMGRVRLLQRYFDEMLPFLVVIEKFAYDKAVEEGGFSPEGVPETNDPALGNVSDWSSSAILIRNAAVVPVVRHNSDHDNDPGYVVVTLDTDGSKYAVSRQEPLAKIIESPGSMYYLTVNLDKHVMEEDAETSGSSSEEEGGDQGDQGDQSGASTGDTNHDDDDPARTIIHMVWFEIVPTTPASLDELSDMETFSIRLRPKDIHMTPASYDLAQLRNGVAEHLDDDDIDLTGQHGMQLERTFKFTYTCPRMFMLDMGHSTMREVLGFDAIDGSHNSGDPPYRQIRFGDNDHIFLSVYHPPEDEEGDWRLTSPGVIFLGGEPYVKLRCPEIEDFLSSSAAGYGAYYTGFAIFKLAGNNMATHLRFDFGNIKHKPIHPIGKLHRLTFRFELMRGGLYDFKGVNNMMLLSIKRYVPSQKMRFEGSVLNPEYDPNFLRYRLRQLVHPEDPSVNLEEFERRVPRPSAPSSSSRRKKRGCGGSEKSDDVDNKDEEDDDDCERGASRSEEGIRTVHTDNESVYDYSTDDSFDDYQNDLQTWR